MNPQLVVALDFPSAALALPLAQDLVGLVPWVKVGLELYLAAGAPIVEQLKAKGFQVFLDLKFLDIPTTVAKAVRQACQQGADMLTVHAIGGGAMVEAAVAAREAVCPATRIVAVTVLTHLTAADMPWVSPPLSVVAHDLACHAQSWGADGVVCSGHEAAAIRASAGPEFLLVTPGLRLPEDAPGDQARVVTPAQAVRAGSNFLVIGRPITGAQDPTAAVRRIMETLTGAQP